MVISNMFLMFIPIPGEMIPNLTCAYFASGLVKNHQLVFEFHPYIWKIPILMNMFSERGHTERKLHLSPIAHSYKAETASEN